MIELIKNITVIEWFGVLFSIVQVLLAQRNNIHNYLFGIAGILLTLYIMYSNKLYAEFTLNIYYLVMSVYGWLYWKFGKQQTETPITKTNNREKTITALIVIVSFVLFYFSLKTYTNSDVPLWDSLVSAFAWAGMWLMAKRKIENWVLLNISNILSIPLLIHKDLYLYAALSAFLFVVAIFGYINWHKILKQQKNG